MVKKLPDSSENFPQRALSASITAFSYTELCLFPSVQKFVPKLMSASVSDKKPISTFESKNIFDQSRVLRQGREIENDFSRLSEKKKADYHGNSRE